MASGQVPLGAVADRHLILICIALGPGFLDTLHLDTLHLDTLHFSSKSDQSISANRLGSK